MIRCSMTFCNIKFHEVLLEKSQNMMQMSRSHVVKCHTNGMKCHIMFGAIRAETQRDRLRLFIN